MKRRPSGPPDDLAAFYADQYGRVRSALTLFTGNRELAEELAQEAFVKTCQHWEKVRKMDAPGAWVHRVGINLAISRARGRATERHLDRRLRSDVDHRGRFSNTDPVAAGGDDGTGLSIPLRAALLSLPVQERAVLVLRFHADLSVAATARVLDCPEGTVKTRTRHGLATLRANSLLLADGGEGSDSDGEPVR